MHFEHSTAAAGSERVDAYAYASGQRAVEVIIFQRDIDDVTGVSLSLSTTHKSHSRTI